jgi:glycosyltransferase involved in cell wall biosynthesis
VQDRVALHGRLARAEVPAAYAAADAVLFPVTWPEPWGLVPLEAMAVGRPVVATGTGGSAEYLRDGENCLLAAPGDPAALARAVARLQSDAALRARLVAGGRATAARHDQRAFVERQCAEIEAAVTMRLRF